MHKNIDPKLLKKICAIAAATVLLLLIAFATLEKTHVTNFISSSSQTEKTPSERAVNNVDYGPPTTEEKDLGDQIKEDAKKQAENSTTNTSGAINISLSAATQDEVGGPIVVRAIVTAQSGSCSITLSGAGYNKELSAPIENLETYYGCGTDISIADLPAGDYTIKLTATSGSATGSVSQSLEVRK